MLFTSFSFFIFLAIVYVIYWSLIKFRKAQNILLLLGSYFFYCAAAMPQNKIARLLFNFRFEEAWYSFSKGFDESKWHMVQLLLLLWLSSSFAYFMGKTIGRQKKETTRKWLMALSATVHLGVLCYFKYFNFFVQSFVDAANTMGWQIIFSPEHILLPLAISFFTFHVLGYTFDVYQETYEPADDYIDFITHVAFFPQLVAGPIERAGHLLPQFTNKRTFNRERMESGISQMLWGFFKKTVVADSIGKFVTYVYANDATSSGSNVILATLAFTIQVYCDFSGYSDIALGCARLLGFELLKNFNFPYFSTSLTEFWRRWHISLSTWITDYLYMPISFSKRSWGKWGIVYAAIISFTLSGLWHGAQWTAALWGLMHGIVLGYEVLTKEVRKKWSQVIPTAVYSVFSAVLVWLFWGLSQLVFRSGSITKLNALWARICSESLFTMPYFSSVKDGLMWGGLLFIVEWIQRKKEYGLDLQNTNYMIRWTAYAAIIVIIFSSDNLNNQNEFLYFQF